LASVNPFLKKKAMKLLCNRLSDQDSNLDRQNQNLQCYHYTIGQFDEQQIYIKKRFCQLFLNGQGGKTCHWRERPLVTKVAPERANKGHKAQADACARNELLEPTPIISVKALRRS
jgi:hypothetical protein